MYHCHFVIVCIRGRIILLDFYLGVSVHASSSHRTPGTQRHSRNFSTDFPVIGLAHSESSIEQWNFANKHGVPRWGSLNSNLSQSSEGDKRKKQTGQLMVSE
jgi:hypothetical protein